MAVANKRTASVDPDDVPNGSMAFLEHLEELRTRLIRCCAAVAIGMIDNDETRNLFNQRQYAGNLVALNDVPGATGVTWGEALAMLTSRAAEAIGMGRELGSLAPGRRADVVVWSGDPLEVTSEAQVVLIDGVPQPLDTRQTRLRDRYRDLRRDVLPEAYRR